MGRVIFPGDAVITENDMYTYHPSQITLRSNYSGDVTVLDYGFPLWRGRTTIDTFDQSDDEKIDAWLSAMDGSANWTLLPHARSSIPTARVLSAELSTFPFTYMVDDATGLAIGQYANIGGKTYRIVAVNGSIVTFMPNIKITLGAIAQATVIPIRLLTQSGKSYTSAANPDWYEPWRITWEEVVGVYLGDGRGFTAGFSKAFN